MKQYRDIFRMISKNRISTFRAKTWNTLCPGKKSGRILFRICSTCMLLTILFIYNETELRKAMSPSLKHTPMIIAHRAGAALAPENTLTAFSEAIHDGADAAEIDIRQLGDGTLIVMHDRNFKRTAGMNLDVRDADYEMLQKVNVGAGQKMIPTLEEFLRAAKGKMRLMLELKIGGFEKEMEQSVLKVIRKLGMEQQCMIASMDFDVLKRVRELTSTIETVYISEFLIIGQYDLNAVDAYSVETTSLSPQMVVQAHSHGKKIYGWTANSGYAVKKILQCGADGIVTDRVLYADHVMKEYGNKRRAKFRYGTLSEYKPGL